MFVPHGTNITQRTRIRTGTFLPAAIYTAHALKGRAGFRRCNRGATSANRNIITA
jgi:hypothetical protein